MQVALSPHQQAIAKLSPAEKLRCAEKLYALAWQLKRAGVRMQHPKWDDAAIEHEVKRIFRHARS